MEWATNAVYLQGRFAVEVLRAEGGPAIVELAELGNRGLPAAHTRRRVVIADFASFATVPGREYASAFSFEPTQCGHQVFAFDDGRRRFLVPCLALMRALFRPHRYVLAEMFKAHALERICHPIVSDETCSISPGSWPANTRDRTLRSVLSPLSWMYHFPSARNMCGSIHEQIVAGRIGMDLPLAKVRMVTRSVDHGSISYVTDVTIVELHPWEEPYPFAGKQQGPVIFHEAIKAAEGRAHRRCARDETIPRHPDGSTDIADNEWRVLGRFFDSPAAQARRRHDPRLLLDSILAKLADGVAWRKARYKVGTSVNAQRLYVELRRTGKWPLICSAIGELRKAALPGPCSAEDSSR